MNRSWCLVTASLLVSTMLSAQEPRSSTGSVPAGDPERGRRLFIEQTCYYCHGTEGQGGLAAVGPRIALVPRGYDSFAEYVRRPTARMSAFSETVLPDADLRDIYAYLRALPEAKPARELPLLEQLRKPGQP